jgi:hypothetical protein
MPIPYRDVDEADELGAAAYLKIEPSPQGSGFVGALFLINARGEPLEFSYNRIETPHTFLWRPSDVRRHAERKLAVSLLSICPRVPRLLLCLADEVGSDLFCQDIQLSIPVCRLAPAIQATAYSVQETVEVADLSSPMNLFWFPSRPQDDSTELRLLRQLTARGLLLEPFERASVGLAEVYRIEDVLVK